MKWLVNACRSFWSSLRGRVWDEDALREVRSYVTDVGQRTFCLRFGCHKWLAVAEATPAAKPAL